MREKKRLAALFLTLSLVLGVPAAASSGTVGSGTANSSETGGSGTGNSSETGGSGTGNDSGTVGLDTLNSGGTAWTPTGLWPEKPGNEEEWRRYELGLPPKSALGFPDADGSPSPAAEAPAGNGERSGVLSPAYTPAPKAGFLDVPEDAYYAAAVDWASYQGITKGVSETAFAPDNTTTRGNVATFLWRWAGETEPGEAGFSDVPEGRYCYDSMRWAAERNVTKGVTETTFNPDGLCTYGHVLTFLWRFMGSPAPDNTGTLAGKYPGRYFQDAAAWAEEQGLLADCLDGFSPDAPCPRRDVVQFLYLMGRLSVAECVELFSSGSSSNGLYRTDGGEAKVTAEMVTSADLWTYGAWNDRPGEHSRLLTMTEEQSRTLVWIIDIQTPYMAGGFPSGGPLKNARVSLVADARTGGVLVTGLSGDPAAES